VNHTPSLLASWTAVLVFRIDEGGVASLDQLPDPLKFPARFPCSTREFVQHAPYALGTVLAVACIKLYRPSPVISGHLVELDMCGGWLLDIDEALRRIPATFGRLVRESCLITFGTVIDLALNAPDRIPLLLQRIDALDNATLHRMAMAAVQGKACPDLFEELWVTADTDQRQSPAIQPSAPEHTPSFLSPSRASSCSSTESKQPCL